MDSLSTTLRPLLTPITHNLPAPLRDAATSLLGQHCYNQLALEVNLSDTDCVKLGVSKGLGMGIITAASIVKIPQLLKLLNSQSAQGVSFLSYLLETASFLITLAYNTRQGFPFSTYGETALISIQNVAIAVLVLRYSGQGAMGVALIAGLVAAGYALFSRDLVDMRMLSYLQAGAGVLGVASKVPQILTVWKQGGTGQLSAFAVFNYLAGSLSRIFTTLQEVDDPLILYGFVSGFVLNAVLALQMIYYWNSPSSKSTKSSKATKSGKKAVRIAGADADSKATTTSSSTKSKSPSTRRRG